MQAPYDNIVQHLFHQPSLYSVTVDELENMAVQHPYFAAAHFLLLKKMQDTAHPEFTSQLHKTTIYFNNPLWLQFLLQPETVANFSVSEKPPFISSDSIEPSHETVEDHSNGYSIDTETQTEHLSTVEEPMHEDASISIPQPEVNESVPADEPVEHGSIMDVITEVFSDPNPLYDTEQVEPVSNGSAEQKHEPATQTDETVQEQIAVPEHHQQEEIPTVSTSSDPWIDITNNAMHQELVAQQQQAEPISPPVPEEIPGQPTEVLEEHNDDNARNEEIIIHQQPAVEEMNSSITDGLNQLPAEIPMEHSDHENHQDHASPELPGHEKGNKKLPEPNSWPFDESTMTADSAYHTQEHEPEKALHAPVENNLTEPPAAAEVKNEETIVSAMTPEQTGDHYIDGALEADATEPAHDTTADQQSNAEQSAKLEEPNFIKTIIETPAAKTDFLFEPYHTVDYFASQGIKLSKMETDSKDKFGKQLKSFTEWLKTMKRLPPSSINKMLAENEESRVVEDANHSIENKEVITVAMAEVFEKQGMNDKAAEVYQKLSLLNPAKSAYFAARIEALKH